jgi:hypothetical protein
MATLQELERALIRADAAGDMEAARQLAAAVRAARADSANQIPGAQVPGTTAQPEAPGFLDQVIGAGESALTLATGATGGTIGTIAGAVRGLGESIVHGQYGTQQGAQTVQRNAQAGGQALTYAPRTEAGRAQVGAIGSALEIVPPVVPVVGPIGAMGQSARAAAPMVTQAVKTATTPIVQAANRAAAPVRQVLQRAPAEAQRAGGSVGSQGMELASQRIATAEQLPVPLTGDSALTKGQATRNAGDIKFEQELMQRGEVGLPIRNRVENQSAVLSRNFEVLIDRIDPAATEIRDLGKNVDTVLKNKMGVANRKISSAYKAARENGEMQEPVQLLPVAPVLADLDRFAGVAPNVNSIRREAIRLGAIREDGNGGLIPGTVSLDDSELLRQFVNEATDWTDKRQSMVAKRVNGSIDEATEGKGGEMYRAARKLKTDYMREFENVGLTKKLTTTKRGTDERRVAYEDVFRTVILDSPIEEMNKMRRTLLTAGPEGKQAWKDLKAKGIEHIREKSSSASSTDQRGTATLSVDKLNRTIAELDAEGKLESLYGKKQAQTLRDLAELSKTIYTAPPGAINTSGTAGALVNAIDSTLTFFATGVPVPARAVMVESIKRLKDRDLQKRLNEALNYSNKKPTPVQ